MLWKHELIYFINTYFVRQGERYIAIFSERLNSCKQNWKIDGLNLSLGSDLINVASCLFIKNLFYKD